jgi:hypothetical protein
MLETQKRLLITYDSLPVFWSITWIDLLQPPNIQHVRYPLVISKTGTSKIKAQNTSCCRRNAHCCGHQLTFWFLCLNHLVLNVCGSILRLIVPRKKAEQGFPAEIIKLTALLHGLLFEKIIDVVHFMRM